MPIKVEPTKSACGAWVTGLDLSAPLSQALVSDLRAHWLHHKVLVFPDQQLSNAALVSFTQCFGDCGDDPFFEAIDGHPNIAAISRKADETTPIFAGSFHTDWSFMDIPPAGTILYGLTIPPQGGDTLFADQVAAYKSLPDTLRDLADKLVAVHSAALSYAPDGLYGEADKQAGRSMQIKSSESARITRKHPFVRRHSETGEKSLFSSSAYIQCFEGYSPAESLDMLKQFYPYQAHEDLIYTHKWRENMLVMWDNRSLLHAASGGYDGYDRLLHRTTIADTQF